MDTTAYYAVSGINDAKRLYIFESKEERGDFIKACKNSGRMVYDSTVNLRTATKKSAIEHMGSVEKFTQACNDRTRELEYHQHHFLKTLRYSY